jgi:arsenate reductase
MIEEIVIMHNPRCSKSCETLKLLEDWGKVPVVRLYLEDKLSSNEIIIICKKLGFSPVELLRKKEQEVKDYIGEFGELSDDSAMKLMIKYPRVIERPIVILGEKAKIGRPPEKVLELL